VDLPNGILSSLGAANAGGTGQVTFEGWARNTGTAPWTRFYDFGSDTAGEIVGPGGGANINGVDFFQLTASTDGGNVHRYEATENDDGDPAGNMWHENTSVSNVDIHFAVTWNETTGELKYYENGKEVGGFSTPVLISAINDINNWLGRSQFTNDANLQGQYDEFRIYDHALSAGEVAGDFQAGPDVVTSNAPQVASVYVHGSTWRGEDNNATNTTFGEFLQNAGLGDKNLGYRVDNLAATSIIPWINVDEVVLRYSGPVSGAGVPTAGSIVVHGQKQDYTVTNVTALDAQTYVLRLGQPLGGAGTTATNGDRITVTVNGAGPGGTNYTTRLNVVQGDVNKSGSVLANDFSEVKARFFQTPNQAAYSPFHDVDGSGSILANDFSAVKARFFQSLPAAPAAVAPALVS
jgi:hypothetical protein